MSTELDLSLQHHDREDDGEVRKEPKVLQLDPSTYPGGIAIWGALPAIYDTSMCPPDQGVHVHARMKVGGKKSIDETFDIVEVQITGTDGSKETFTVNGDAASNYNVSTILKKKIKYLKCPNCDNVHSDKDWFAVNYHQEHDCEKCGEKFADTEPSISNPVMFLKKICGDVLQDRPIIDPVERKISVKQAKYPGGIQIWGSNPAIIWTSPKLEEGGIHFHGFYKRIPTPTVDETFGVLDFDDVMLDPEMVRHLMAQQGLPYLLPYLCTLICPNCHQSHFDKFDLAATPHSQHLCEYCNHEFDSPEDKELAVSNPLIDLVAQFYRTFHELFPEVVLSR